MLKTENFTRLKGKRNSNSEHVITHPHTNTSGFGDPNRFGDYCGGNLDNWIDFTVMN